MAHERRPLAGKFLRHARDGAKVSALLHQCTRLFIYMRRLCVCVALPTCTFVGYYVCTHTRVIRSYVTDV